MLSAVLHHPLETETWPPQIKVWAFVSALPAVEVMPHQLNMVEALQTQQILNTLNKFKDIFTIDHFVVIFLSALPDKRYNHNHDNQYRAHIFLNKKLINMFDVFHCSQVGTGKSTSSFIS